MVVDMLDFSANVGGSWKATEGRAGRTSYPESHRLCTYKPACPLQMMQGLACHCRSTGGLLGDH